MSHPQMQRLMRSLGDPLDWQPEGWQPCCEDRGGDDPNWSNGDVDLIDFAVHMQRRVVSIIFIAEFNGLVDRVEQMLFLQSTLQYNAGHREALEE